MTIISLDSAEVRGIQTYDPDRKYEQLEGNFGRYLVLIEEAQQVRLGQRTDLSVAYRALSESRFGIHNFVDVRNKRKLKKLAESL
mgnify:CR=1 FL=1